jgi:hypothetical protein
VQVVFGAAMTRLLEEKEITEDEGFLFDGEPTILENFKPFSLLRLPAIVVS